MTHSMLNEDEVDIQTLGTFSRSMPARILENALRVNTQHTNALLHKDEWQRLEHGVVQGSATVLPVMVDWRMSQEAEGNHSSFRAALHRALHARRALPQAASPSRNRWPQQTVSAPCCPVLIVQRQ
jgi:hypothetical protein